MTDRETLPPGYQFDPYLTKSEAERAIAAAVARERELCKTACLVVGYEIYAMGDPDAKPKDVIEKCVAAIGARGQ